MGLLAEDEDEPVAGVCWRGGGGCIENKEIFGPMKRHGPVFIVRHSDDPELVSGTTKAANACACVSCVVYGKNQYDTAKHF